jgi:hypothetical protein
VDDGLRAPERTLTQRLAALNEANRIRTKRARLKRDLTAGRASLLDLMVEPDCATMKTMDALLALPKVGRVKAERALRRAKVSPSKTLAGMTDRQRRELLAELPVCRPAPPMMARC